MSRLLKFHSNFLGRHIHIHIYIYMDANTDCITPARTNVCWVNSLPLRVMHINVLTRLYGNTLVHQIYF